MLSSFLNWDLSSWYVYAKYLELASVCTVSAWASVKIAINNIYSVLKWLFLLEASLNTLHKHQHEHTDLLLHFHLFNVIAHFTLDTSFFSSCLHSNDNEVGEIPDTPSTMLDIVLSTTIESSWGHEDQRPKHYKHKWDHSLWMTCTQSLWSLRIRVCTLFPCHGVLRLKSSRLWAVSSDEPSSPQTSNITHSHIMSTYHI